MTDRRCDTAQNTDTPWMRLNTLLATQQIDILNREKNNGQYIYLYANGINWIAFEKSAWQLCKLFQKHDISILYTKTYPFPIVMASVANNDIQSYFHQHIIRDNTQGHKILKVPSFPMRQYAQWHRAVVKGLL